MPDTTYFTRHEGETPEAFEARMGRAIVMTPARVGTILKRAFGLRDGIKELTLHLNKDEVTLSVVYFVPDDRARMLENLEEFTLVPKAK
jgi:hypothetical protein